MNYQGKCTANFKKWRGDRFVGTWSGYSIIVHSGPELLSFTTATGMKGSVLVFIEIEDGFTYKVYTN